MPEMSEAELQRSVIELARLYKWKIVHFRGVAVRRKDGSIRYQTPVQGDGAGFPDLVLVRDKVIFIELKSDRGTLSQEQALWMEALVKARGVVAYILRPRDWLDGTIDKILK